MLIIDKKIKPASFRRTLLTGLAACAAFALAACGDSVPTEPPVYEATPDRLHEGSLYYAKAGCHSCHGTKWDGKGPEAANLSIAPTDFTQMKDPKKSETDYFIAITKGNKALDKAGVKHSLQHYTDRGRWAMANFLFSLAPKLEGAGATERNNSRAAGRQKAQEAYAKAAKNGLRRWELGYKPARERAPVPKLADLMK